MELIQLFVILTTLLLTTLSRYGLNDEDYVVTIKNNTLFGQVNLEVNFLNPFSKYKIRLSKNGSDTY